MVIQLPKETEERLRELADRTGTRAEQLAADAIDAMLECRGKLDRWPPSKVVGIVERSDDAAWVESTDVGSADTQPWPKSAGMLRDGGVPATELEDWLAATWKLD